MRSSSPLNADRISLTGEVVTGKRVLLFDDRHVLWHWKKPGSGYSTTLGSGGLPCGHDVLLSTLIESDKTISLQGSVASPMFGVPIERLLQWTTALYLLSLALTTLCGAAFWWLTTIVMNGQQIQLAHVREQANVRVALAREEERRARLKISREAADSEARAQAAAEDAREATKRWQTTVSEVDAWKARARTAKERASDAEARAAADEEQLSGLQEKEMVPKSAERTQLMSPPDTDTNFAPRRLVDADARILQDGLSKLKNTVPEVSVTRLGDMEAWLYANDIIAAFQAAGIRVAYNTIGTMTPPVYGVLVYEDQSNAAISSALMKAGVLVRSEPQGGRPITQIVVGLKPFGF